VGASVLGASCRPVHAVPEEPTHFVSVMSVTSSLFRRPARLMPYPLLDAMQMPRPTQPTKHAQAARSSHQTKKKKLLIMAARLPAPGPSPASQPCRTRTNLFPAAPSFALALPAISLAEIRRPQSVADRSSFCQNVKPASSFTTTHLGPARHGSPR